MARPKARTLYRRKNSRNWLFWLPETGVVDTNETDRFRAEQKLNERVRAASSEPPDLVRETLAKVAEQRLDPEEENPFADVQVDELPAERLFDDDPPEPVAKPQVDTVAKPLDQPASSSEPEKPAVSRAMSALAKKLTPGAKNKIMDKISAGAARVNALAFNLPLAMAGLRIKGDYVVDVEDLEVMKLGYSMLVEEIFDLIDPKWYHVVIVGNVLFGLTVIDHIEKKPKVAPPLKVVPPDAESSNGT